MTGLPLEVTACGRTRARGTLTVQAGPVPTPLPPEDPRRRVAVLELARSERRRVHPALVHVGTPGGEAVVVAGEVGWDHAARVDLLSRLLWSARECRPLVWLTRTGALEWQDRDAEWFAACRAAGSETGLEVDFLVVTRHGWWEPRTGDLRTWKRIRDRNRRPTGQRVG